MSHAHPANDANSIARALISYRFVASYAPANLMILTIINRDSKKAA